MLYIIFLCKYMYIYIFAFSTPVYLYIFASHVLDEFLELIVCFLLSRCCFFVVQNHNASTCTKC